MNANQAAQTLLDCWRNGQTIDQLAESDRPETPEQGYTCQATLAGLRDESVRGWKIAATAEAGRQHINVQHPLAGRLYQSIVHGNGAQISLTANRMRMAEAEIVLIIGKDIAPRSEPYSAQELMPYVSDVAPGLEFPDSRFADFTKVGAACLLADNACAYHFVLGESVAATEVDLANLPAQATQLMINDQLVTHGTGADALGGPMQALAWIANTLSAMGMSLQHGQFVTTGVTGQPSPVAPGDSITVDAGPIGRVSAHLT